MHVCQTREGSGCSSRSRSSSGGGGGGYNDSKGSSGFANGTSTWWSRVSAPATGAPKGSASGASGTGSANECNAAGVTDTCAGNVQKDDTNGDHEKSAAYPISVHSRQLQRQSGRHSSETPHVAAVRRAKWGTPLRASKPSAGLYCDAAAVSARSFASALQAPVTGTSKSPGGHVTYHGTPSSGSPLVNANVCASGPESQPLPNALASHSPRDSKDNEMGIHSSEEDCCLTAAHAAPESAPSAVRTNNYGCGDGGGGGDVRRTANRSEEGTVAGPDTEDDFSARASPSPGTTTAAPLTYAAVASSSSSSPLPGKRLPQSRVGFRQRCKVVCSGRASLPNTGGGTNATPGTSAGVVLKDASPSFPPTLTIPSANPAHATDKGALTSAPLSVGRVVEHEVANNMTQRSLANTMMPPLPPSVHRHQPTHLILRLPNTRSSQQAPSGSTPDEERMTYYGSSRLAGASEAAAPSTEPSSPAAPPPNIHRTSSALALRPPSLQIVVTPFTHSPSPSQALSERIPVTSGGAPGEPTTAQQQQQQSSTPSPSAAIRRSSLTPGDPNRVLCPTHPATAAVPVGKDIHRAVSTTALFKAVEILPGLFLGSYADASDPETLAAHGISLVINCALECSVTPAMANNNSHVRYAQFLLRDHSDEPIAPFFTPVTRIIHDQLHRRHVKQQCMAHCAAADASSLNTHEAENVWAVPQSPASPLRSVGGQPSLKNGERKTPGTPSSAPRIGVRLGEGSRCSSSSTTTTSFSASPTPNRAATFPPVAAAAAAGVGPDATDGLAAKQSSNDMCKNTSTTTTTSFPGVAAPPPESSSSTPLASAITPFTVVDPRDCGGVLVHCRMGVSRSATFIIAYLILYGCALAHLDDTASLFVYFLERERRIIEEAGGVTSFTDNSDRSAPHTMTPASPRRGSGCCTNGSATVMPLTSAPSLVGRPVGSSRASLNGNFCTTSRQHQSSASLANSPIEFASRVCRACYLMRLRERCFDHQPQRPLLVSGKQQLSEVRGKEEQLQQEPYAMIMRRRETRRESTCEVRGVDGHSCCSNDSMTSDSGYNVHPEQQKPRQLQHHYHRRAFSALPSPAPTALHRISRRSSMATPHRAACTKEGVQEGDSLDGAETHQQRCVKTMTRSQRLAARNALTTPTRKTPERQLQSTSSPFMDTVALTETPVMTPGHSAVFDTRLDHDKNVCSNCSPHGEEHHQNQQQQLLSCSSNAPLSISPHTSSRAHSDLHNSLDTLLGANLAHSGGSGGTANRFHCVTSAMTYRDAFDVVKRQKTDINPNIGFIMALHELAGESDLSSSISL
ncbi:hypothetical protein JKF63_07400 [Porcisia hertigi]|uniref:protein-tyrosine-phosphatase n=1 Tax=Porcisia hertigi TaxID=2761500 RepID=A0A836LKV4_9TRYP|nr:hypothetical protein JKF63_07400 [Porcisia hertigi]